MSPLRSCVYLSVLLACTAAAADSNGEAARILAGIVTDKSAPIPFAERRTSKLLDEPMALSGEIAFTADGILIKRIEQPIKESVRISEHSIELQRNGRTKRLSLDRRADVRAFYAGMRALLSGDTDSLFQLFDADALTDGEDWTIELTPKTEDLQSFLASLTVTGSGSRVRTFVTVQPGGDWQELSFTAVGN